jgi:hypothetical protein
VCKYTRTQDTHTHTHSREREREREYTHNSNYVPSSFKALSSTLAVVFFISYVSVERVLPLDRNGLRPALWEIFLVCVYGTAGRLVQVSLCVCVCCCCCLCERASVYRHHHRIFPLTSSSASTFFSLSPVHVRLLSSPASSSVGPVEWWRLVLLTAVPFSMLSDSRAVSTPLQLFGESVT